MTAMGRTRGTVHQRATAAAGFAATTPYALGLSDASHCIRPVSGRTFEMEKTTQYTALFKRKAILLSEEIGNSPAARRLGLESTIRGWRKNRDKICHAEPTRKAFRGPTQGGHHSLEASWNGAPRRLLQCSRVVADDAELALMRGCAGRTRVPRR